MSDTTEIGQIRLSKPVVWSADRPAERALVVLLTGVTDERDVDVLLATFDVEDAIDDWLVLLADETGLDAPICVLLDSRTRIVADALEDTVSTIGPAALDLLRQALAGDPDPDRIGAPVRSPDDERLESSAVYRQLRAALERIERSAVARASRRRFELPAAAFGLVGARAATPAPREQLTVPDPAAPRRLSVARVGTDLEITAEVDDQLADAVLLIVAEQGPLAIALHSGGRGRIAIPIDQLRISDVSLVIDEVAWRERSAPLARAEREAVEGSLELADHATRRALQALLDAAPSDKA